MQPYLLAHGETKRNIGKYYVIIDHLALPCPTREALGAFDALFKSHYIFGLEYSSYLYNFWTFLQTTIFKIDTDNSREPPRIREVRSKLQL